MYQVLAYSKVSPSWGLVGYFTSLELAERQRVNWSDKWNIIVTPLELDTPFVVECPVSDPKEAWLQSTRSGRMDGINQTRDPAVRALEEIQASLKRYLGAPR
jgi:hypothetical protein